MRKQHCTIVTTTSTRTATAMMSLRCNLEGMAFGFTVKHNYWSPLMQSVLKVTENSTFPFTKMRLCSEFYYDKEFDLWSCCNSEKNHQTHKSNWECHFSIHFSITIFTHNFTFKFCTRRKTSLVVDHDISANVTTKNLEKCTLGASNPSIYTFWARTLATDFW